MGRGALLSVLMLYEAKPTLFDDMQVPTGINKATLVDKLVSDCAELEVIYPDPDMMKESLKFWSAAHIHNWEIEYASLNKAGYDPFIDYDRNEDYNSNYTDYPAATTTTSQRAFNDATLTDVAKITQGGTLGGWKSHTLHQYGNSALGTNQDIIRKEIEIRNEYNIMDLIIADFKKDFCICVY